MAPGNDFALAVCVLQTEILATQDDTSDSSCCVQWALSGGQRPGPLPPSLLMTVRFVFTHGSLVRWGGFSLVPEDRTLGG